MIRTSSPDARVTLIEIDRHERRNALDIAHLDDLHEAVVGAGADAPARSWSPASGRPSAPAPTRPPPTAVQVPTGMAFARPSTARSGDHHAPDPGPGRRAGTGHRRRHPARDRLRPAGGGTRRPLAVPTARDGLAVDPWTVRRLGVLAGGGTCRAMLLGADTLGAGTAFSRGLVDRLASTDTLDTALDWAREIADLAPLTLTYSKLAADRLTEPPVDDPELVEAFLACWSSEDVREAHRAGAERRPAVFHGH